MLTKYLKTTCLYLLLTAIALGMLFPLFWLISTAFKSPTENIFSFPIKFLPEKATFENFKIVWANYPFAKYLLNSTIVAVLTVTLNLTFCSLAAYPLARLNFKGKNLIFSLIIATIMIPFQIIMIPLYILAVKLKLLNSFFGIIFPSIASAFGIYLLRQGFQGVPKELEEAARLDGCTELGLWWFVMIPAIRPSLVTLAIFVFIGSWSDFLWPLIVLNDPNYYTLPIGVATLANALTLNWRYVAAGSVIAMVPVLVFFLFVQRYIIPTDTGSGIKG